MDKTKIDEAKAKLKDVQDTVLPKVKSALSEIKTNFKADEGTTGFPKVKSMFVNLWKSGTYGRAALVASSVILFSLLVSVCGSSGESSGGGKRIKPVPKDTLVVKGLYMGMPGDDAVEACKEMVGEANDLVVVDLRNGIEIEHEAGLGEYEKKTQELFSQHHEKRLEYLRQQHTQEEADAAGFGNFDLSEFKKIHPPTEEELAASKQKVKEVVSKEAEIRISIKEDGVREDKLSPICYVEVDNQGNVKETYYTEGGMARFFNAGDLSCKEFAQALVTHYKDIPSLEPTVSRQGSGGAIEEITWTYKDPRGYKVKLFERSIVYHGIKYTSKMLDSDPNAKLSLAFIGKLPQKYFTILAIKPESARKFD